MCICFCLTYRTPYNIYYQFYRCIKPERFRTWVHIIICVIHKLKYQIAHPSLYV